MKFNNNNDKQNELEMDDMNIKSHLNTSLDLSGISVSEDLINRTLEAIKKQSAEQPVSLTSSKDRSKKVISWNKYVRGFATVAAAVVIVVVGYNAMSQLNFGNMKKDSNSMESADDSSINNIMMEEAEENTSFGTSENAELDIAFDTTAAGISEQKPKEEPSTESAPQYTITADAFEATDEADNYGSDARDGATGVEGMTESTEPVAPLPKVSSSLKSSDPSALLTFRDIFLLEPEKVEYLMITDEINDTAITLTTQDQIMEFYLLMDQHQFTNGTEDGSEQNYTVEVKSPEEAMYTLIVGTYITVRYAEGDTVSQSIYLAVDDLLLKQNLEEFYKKFNK